MARYGFKRNAKTVERILKTSQGAIAMQRRAAGQVLKQINDPEAEIVEYETDRHVVAIRFPADKQAKNGTATKAASAAGLSRGKP
ncbi:hypothetical protein A3N99_02820 [Mycobacteroides abscessus]|uniref:hypothetical protein n=1 Tax=Mycobacteroides abscessus TaxID=36809 RepID=UPI00078E4F03|nr:hypothetical protein [Mycobacteroides abscessus]AMU39240.1 hypothetical protein A3N99_02820 [Mycobacteroides abscessus]